MGTVGSGGGWTPLLRKRGDGQDRAGPGVRPAPRARCDP
jgi:hypothetical protein